MEQNDISEIIHCIVPLVALETFLLDFILASSALYIVRIDLIFAFICSSLTEIPCSFNPTRTALYAESR